LLSKDVYILNTGIYERHDFIGGRIKSAFDAVGDSPLIHDPNGHGTHIAGKKNDITTSKTLLKYTQSSLSQYLGRKPRNQSDGLLPFICIIRYRRSLFIILRESLNLNSPDSSIGLIGGDHVGLARKAALHDVRVLDSDGLGSTATVLSGLDYVAGNNVIARASTAAFFVVVLDLNVSLMLHFAHILEI